MIGTDSGDWWLDLMEARRADGVRDAEYGLFNPPYPDSNDPQDEIEDAAYRRGFEQRRRELSDV